MPRFESREAVAARLEEEDCGQEVVERARQGHRSVVMSPTPLIV